MWNLLHFGIWFHLVLQETALNTKYGLTVLFGIIVFDCFEIGCNILFASLLWHLCGVAQNQNSRQFLFGISTKKKKALSRHHRMGFASDSHRIGAAKLVSCWDTKSSAVCVHPTWKWYFVVLFWGCWAIIHLCATIERGPRWLCPTQRFRSRPLASKPQLTQIVAGLWEKECVCVCVWIERVRPVTRKESLCHKIVNTTRITLAGRVIDWFIHWNQTDWSIRFHQSCLETIRLEILKRGNHLCSKRNTSTLTTTQ